MAGEEEMRGERREDEERQRVAMRSMCLLLSAYPFFLTGTFLFFHYGASLSLSYCPSLSLNLSLSLSLSAQTFVGRSKAQAVRGHRLHRRLSDCVPGRAHLGHGPLLPPLHLECHQAAQGGPRRGAHHAFHGTAFVQHDSWYRSH